ncbi:pth11-like integral membrane protein [Sporothrix brasiliensis 5110]|uniref:Pth11-like integral membrane protein n=1 Tax=Sporothrix brasiliensis 5110 TaxID=1398154 RepID=A0A0C2J6Z8_9PEZI|nr:pth11-like integral membrane protein [Sporothrix brasiliensis 5110]KIH94765.1 pth11-like integral membrane protein [Sporothrix brasiliensis 5110]
MGLYSDPPPMMAFAEVKPTLLVCWWSTIFCLTIILLRIAGRYIRSERLFIEDRVVSLAIIPLFIRMGCVHVILIYGTNNVALDSFELSEVNLHRRAVGSGLVLASRVFHAATLWIFKIAILEFFKRISDALSERFSQVALIAIRCFLVVTFIAVVISDLSECHPFVHYWQVAPDPGGQCRQGFAQLLTMSVCNVFTDLLLVLFPVPFIFFSHQSVKRKVQLILLFSLSLGVVGITIYRATRVIQEHGNQQLRSLLASVELLFATAAANSLVLGSFVRDRGVKKNKFRAGSVVDSMERSSVVRSRRPTANRHWGSDEDLVRDLGLGVQPELRDAPDSLIGDDIMFGSPGGRAVRPAPILKVDGSAVDPLHQAHDNSGEGSSHSGGDSSVGHCNGHGAAGDFGSWQFPENRRRSAATNSAQSAQSGLSGLSGQSDDDTLLARDPLSPASRNNSTFTPRKVAFFDAGNLLGGDSGSGDNESEPDTARISTAGGVRSPTSIGGGVMRSSTDSVPPSPAHTASGRGFRRGSTALLQDLGGLLGPPTSRNRQRSDGHSPTLQTLPQGTPMQMPPSPLSSSQSPTQSGHATPSNLDNLTLMDPGGLLSSPGPHRRV